MARGREEARWGPRHTTLVPRNRGKLNVLWCWGKGQAKVAKHCGRESSRKPPAGSGQERTRIPLSSHILLAASRSPGWPGTDRCSAWLTSLVGALGSPGVPLKSFDQVKGQIVVPAFLWDCGRKTSLLFSRGSVSGLPSCPSQVRA